MQLCISKWLKWIIDIIRFLTLSTSRFLYAERCVSLAESRFLLFVPTNKLGTASPFNIAFISIPTDFPRIDWGRKEFSVKWALHNLVDSFGSLKSLLVFCTLNVHSLAIFGFDGQEWRLYPSCLVLEQFPAIQRFGIATIFSPNELSNHTLLQTFLRAFSAFAASSPFYVTSGSARPNRK